MVREKGKKDDFFVVGETGLWAGGRTVWVGTRAIIVLGKLNGGRGIWVESHAELGSLVASDLGLKGLTFQNLSCIINKMG